MIISIVIPVFNLERYITKCLESIETQNFSQDKYEVIIVNDNYHRLYRDKVGAKAIELLRSIKFDT